MPSIKGTCVNSVLAFVDESFGAGTAARLLASLPGPDRAALDLPLMASSWYPIASYLAFLGAAERDGLMRDEAVWRRMGARIVSDGLTGVYRLFLSVLSRDFILGKVPKLWGRYFDGEHLELVEVTETSLVARVSGDVPAGNIYCQTVLGGIEETLRRAGGRDVKGVEIRCRGRFAPCCEFRVSWSVTT